MQSQKGGPGQIQGQYETGKDKLFFRSFSFKCVLLFPSLKIIIIIIKGFLLGF
jgi:hypothetical protein